MSARATLDAAITEGELQQAIIDLARVLGLLIYHPYDSRRSEPGYPDLTIVGAQTIVYAELKSETGKLRPEQREWREAIERVAQRPRKSYHSAIEYHLWRPAQWSDGTIEETLRRLV